MKAETVAGRTIQNVTFPPDVMVVAVQRGATLITPSDNVMLESGDLVYLAGTDKGLEYMAKLLEGYVITSYSIHYTKLYESVLLRIRVQWQLQP